MALTDRSSMKETRFHDYTHAVEYDRKAAKSDIRAELAVKLVEALELEGGELVLDLATGTGRFARPVCHHLKGGRVVGVDQAFAMLKVGSEQKGKESIPGYAQVAGNAEALPLCDRTFDRAFVAFAFHHFGAPTSQAVREIRRILKAGGKFFILDPVLVEPEDTLDKSLNEWINQVFQRTHGENFSFKTASGIAGLLAGESFEIVRSDRHRFSIDQSGMDGIPTGRHWLEVAEELEREPEEVRARFEKSYFVRRKEGDQARIKGQLGYAIICGEKRDD